MPELEKAHERIQAISEKIRLEVLEPAQEQAALLIDEAKKEALRIKEKAHREAEQIRQDITKSLEEEKHIFHSSLEQAAKQSIELLKQKIENALFNPTLEKWIIKEMGNSKEHAKLIEALVKAINKEGIRTDLTVVIPQTFSAETIATELSRDILTELAKSSIELGEQKAGIKVIIKDKHIMLDMSDSTLKELISSFVRKDFRKIFFGA
jgi:V/A-type H+/Na+-transporting ATPase subunit E